MGEAERVEECDWLGSQILDLYMQEHAMPSRGLEEKSAHSKALHLKD